MIEQNVNDNNNNKKKNALARLTPPLSSILLQCEKCNLHFRHKSQLRLHLRQKHGAITNTKIQYRMSTPTDMPTDLTKVCWSGRQAEGTRLQKKKRGKKKEAILTLAFKKKKKKTPNLYNHQIS